ncbi:DUF4251 domain-containing protein [Flavobacteriaceae bacterium GSB9]|nr:DUF4251 domain-containing protein [Flavobacteriaceae bacterium GSB9]
MKISKFKWGIVVMILFLSCGVSKNPPSEAELATLNELVNKRDFTIESDWAYPQATMAMQQVMNSGLMLPGDNAANISLVGNYNFLKIKGDSITSHLPYFGERQMQVDYGGMDSAIQFKGLMENYKVEKNKNHGYNISFSATSNRERFNVLIAVSPSLKTNMVLNGVSRFPIRYSGTASLISEKNKE